MSIKESLSKIGDYFKEKNFNKNNESGIKIICNKEYSPKKGYYQTYINYSDSSKGIENVYLVSMKDSEKSVMVIQYCDGKIGNNCNLHLTQDGVSGEVFKYEKVFGFNKEKFTEYKNSQEPDAYETFNEALNSFEKIDYRFPYLNEQSESPMMYHAEVFDGKLIEKVQMGSRCECAEEEYSRLLVPNCKTVLYVDKLNLNEEANAYYEDQNYRNEEFLRAKQAFQQIDELKFGLQENVDLESFQEDNVQ